MKPFVPSINNNFCFPSVAKFILEDIKSGNPVCLVGHTGCGKTSMIEQIAAINDKQIIRVNLNGQTTISDFVGLWTVKAGQTEWINGFLPTAMTYGMWLLLDEIDFAEPTILSALNSVLEPCRTLTIKEKGFEIVQAHPDFRIFATANTIGCMSQFRQNYGGTNHMNDAFIDRFSIYKIDYMDEANESNLLCKVTGCSTEFAEKATQVASLIRKAFSEGEVSSTISTRRLLAWASFAAKTGNNHMDSAKISLGNRANPQDWTVIEGIMSRVFPEKGV